jgi:ribosomal protein S18 acetylase RimI-like enzyme
MILRDYAASDQESVLSLNTHAADPGWRIDPQSPTYADLQDVEGVYQAEGAFLVGELNGELIAMGGFKPAGQGIVELKRIRVRDEHRRNGYARELILELETRARALGAHTMILDTTVEQEPAQRLYESLGYSFTHNSERVGTNRTFRLVHYQKHLTR